MFWLFAFILFFIVKFSKWSNQTKWSAGVVIVAIYIFTNPSSYNQQTTKTYQECLEEAKQFNRKHMASFAQPSECYQYKKHH
jgi:4-amino-4-deoxy-L-arabinose transferase-like glycosyltransferase